MRISYYCQHVLGIGHLRRSLEICKALAIHHETTLILGGPQVGLDTRSIQILQLPGLRMDPEFNNLTPCNHGFSLEEVKEKRQNQLYNHFRTNKPQCFITELYPFGRKAFRFELDPVLKGLRSGELAKCHSICSVRDILVEKVEGREKFERRVVKTLNEYFDGVLIHADPEIVRLEETFAPLGEVAVPLYYTGFVSEKISPRDIGKLRDQLGLESGHKLIVASAGGGGVGTELLHAVIPAFKRLLEIHSDSHLQIFTGPYCPEPDYLKLKAEQQKNIVVDRFTDHFPNWLAAADLSISMAGYNTSMNILQAATPALVYPFMQNREQTLRVDKLGKKAPIRSLFPEDLTPERFSEILVQQLEVKKQPISINLDGATNSCRLIDQHFL